MRYLMEFSYDGSKFFGYQKQKDVRTIQEELEQKLTIINNGVPVSVSASGRTDAGVHALGQCAHFDLTISITPEKLKKAMNSLIDKSIYIKSIREVADDFHARFNVKSKKYVYKMNLGEYNPIDKDYIYQYNNLLDIEKMKEAIKLFVGTHNFKSFTKANCEVDDYVRTIYEASICINNDVLEINFKGSGFMRYMVRNMVGFLIEIGECKRSPEDVLSVLEKGDRTAAGKTAKPEGLYLVEVFY